MAATKNEIKKLSESGKLSVVLLLLFAAAALYYKLYILAAAEGAAVIALIVYMLIYTHRRQQEIAAYVESVAYESDNAKSSTLSSFPLPIVVFCIDDSRIVWGNDMFFGICGNPASRLDANLSELVPQFSADWLTEGKKQCQPVLEVGGVKYQVFGNVIHSDSDGDSVAYMGITYWVDITEHEKLRERFEKTRPVAGVVIIDNLDELTKNQPERIKNDLRDAVEEKLVQWTALFGGMIRRYSRDRYIIFIEHSNMEQLKAEKFRIIEQMHQIVSPSGIAASISIGLGADSDSFAEALQFADTAGELALSRGGDQAVIKNKLSFEFYGGRGLEVERRTRVKSRVTANAFAELIRESSRVFVMGHRFGDLDSLGASIGVCSLARQLGVKSNIVADIANSAAKPLADMVRKEPEYRDTFMTVSETVLKTDSKTLLVVVDTSRPEQVDAPELLRSCSRVVVIDHHRVAATYIKDLALSFIEPFASSACELVAELIQELPDTNDILRCEAEALLAGIVLDTKSFTLRTGERTFDAAAYLRRMGADTASVKRLFQSDMDATVAKYRILECVKPYRGVAVAAPETPQDRIAAAQAADELLNISGVDASIVIAPDGKGGAFASARSIGDINVQLIMEKLGGGGNRSAAACRFDSADISAAVDKVHAAIDDYYA